MNGCVLSLAMEQRESDLAVVCRLAQEHLSDGATRNDILRCTMVRHCMSTEMFHLSYLCLSGRKLVFGAVPVSAKAAPMGLPSKVSLHPERRLPRDFRSGVDEIVKDMVDQK